MIATALNISEMVESALSMPRPERSYIAERLLISLDNDEMSAHWREEMDARVRRRESGETRSYSHEEVMAELETVIA
jgi:hypothetical protein